MRAGFVQKLSVGIQVYLLNPPLQNSVRAGFVQKLSVGIQVYLLNPPLHNYLATILHSGAFQQKRLAIAVYACTNYFANIHCVIAFFHGTDNPAF